jgi:prevent-host-death family protein
MRCAVDATSHPTYSSYKMYDTAEQHEGTHISVSGARDDFANLVNRVAYKEERVIITRRGRAIAAIVPIEDVAYLERLEDEYDVQQALQVINDPNEMANTVPWEQVEAEFDAQKKGLT